MSDSIMMEEATRGQGTGSTGTVGRVVRMAITQEERTAVCGDKPHREEEGIKKKKNCG